VARAIENRKIAQRADQVLEFEMVGGFHFMNEQKIVWIAQCSSATSSHDRPIDEAIRSPIIVYRGARTQRLLSCAPLAVLSGAAKIP
jgi:hypothetical protein